MQSIQGSRFVLSTAELFAVTCADGLRWARIAVKLVMVGYDATYSHDAMICSSEHGMVLSTGQRRRLWRFKRRPFIETLPSRSRAQDTQGSLCRAR